MQWNKVTWYSKGLAMALFVILPFVGAYYGFKLGVALRPVGGSAVIPPESVSSASTSTSGASSASEGLIPYYTTPSEWQTDSNNTAGGFSIAYPLDFDAQDNYSPTPSTDWRLDANGAPGIAYFTLMVPRAFEPQTNFVDATLTVGASANSAAVAECLAPDPGDGPSAEEATSSVTINGVSFIEFHTSGAGAGNTYDTTSYRTLHAGKCYAVEYTVHSGQILNYPAFYNLQPFDESKVDALMDNIVGTFTFM
jgi:hypothetical protein